MYKLQWYIDLDTEYTIIEYDSVLYQLTITSQNYESYILGEININIITSAQVLIENIMIFQLKSKIRESIIIDILYKINNLYDIISLPQTSNNDIIQFIYNRLFIDLQYASCISYIQTDKVYLSDIALDLPVYENVPHTSTNNTIITKAHQYKTAYLLSVKLNNH